MNSIYSVAREYIRFVYDLGFVATFYAVFLVALFLGLIVYDYLGYSARITRGSKRTIKFFKDKGWIDNSNISLFLVKCLRYFPYTVRAGFSLFCSSHKPFLNFVNDKSYNSRDYEIRERVIKYIYDFMLILGSCVTLIFISSVYSIFDAISYLIIIIVAVIFRYILMGIVTSREIIAKKKFFKAVDLMANGIFLSDNKSVEVEDEESYSDFLSKIDDNIKTEYVSNTKCEVYERINQEPNDKEIKEIANDFLDSIRKYDNNNESKVYIDREAQDKGIIVDNTQPDIDNIAIDKTQ